MLASSPAPSVRGVALAGGLHGARAVAPAAVEAVVGSASAPLREALSDLQPRAWYPVALHFELLGRLYEDVAGHDTARLAQMVYRGAERDLRGIYGRLLRVATPSYAVAHTGRLLAAYLNYARVEVSSQTVWTADVDVALAPASGPLWHGLSGLWRAALDAVGATRIKIAVTTDDGQDRCRYRIRWD